MFLGLINITFVRDQHPPKQGLRPDFHQHKTLIQYLVRDQHPPKQGLRRNELPRKVAHHLVRDQHPPKQGLRPAVWFILIFISMVRDQHPPKQGLRLLLNRPYYSLIKWSETNIHQNKD